MDQINNMQWNLCSDGLPEKNGGDVLVTLKAGAETAGGELLANSVYMAMFVKEEDEWAPYFLLYDADRNGHEYFNEVIAWMPVPAAYESRRSK